MKLNINAPTSALTTVWAIGPKMRPSTRCSEKIGSEFEVRAVPENLGKAGSLKKNYGSWQLRKQRRRLQLPAD